MELAILNDPYLNERQKQSLLDVYASFLALNTTHREGVNEAMAKFDIRNDLKFATKPLYAGVGVTDLAVERVRGLVTEAQKRTRSGSPRPRRTSARSTSSPRPCATRRPRRVDALAKDAKARRAAIEKRVAEAQADAKSSRPSCRRSSTRTSPWAAPTTVWSPAARAS